MRVTGVESQPVDEQPRPGEMLPFKQRQGRFADVFGQEVRIEKEQEPEVIGRFILRSGLEAVFPIPGERGVMRGPH